MQGNPPENTPLTLSPTLTDDTKGIAAAPQRDAVAIVAKRRSFIVWCFVLCDTMVQLGTDDGQAVLKKHNDAAVYS
eukprot:scaffold4733_cov170-Alexandrium_tamarense.AAC.34